MQFLGHLSVKITHFVANLNKVHIKSPFIFPPIYHSLLSENMGYVDEVAKNSKQSTCLAHDCLVCTCIDKVLKVHRMPHYDYKVCVLKTIYKLCEYHSTLIESIFIFSYPDTKTRSQCNQ